MTQPGAAHPFHPRDLGVLLCAAVLLCPALGETPLTRAEIYFADAARAMVERGDWLVPYFRGAPFFDKPALTYWLIAASFDVLGFSVTAARAGLALATVGVLLCTIWLGWLLWRDRQTALLGGWLLLGTAAFMSFGRLAMSDMLLTFWTTLGMALAAASYQTDRPFRFIVGLGAVLGFGFLTKGPIALLVIGLGCVALLWVRRRDRLPVSAASAAVGAIVFGAIASSWFIAVYLRLGIEPLEYFFIRENLQRFAAETYDAGRPVWFYVTAYLGEGAPWSLFLPLAAWQLLRVEPDRNARMLLIWMLLVAMLLSASRGKIDYYLLPLYPAAALVVGRYFNRVAWGSPARAWARVVLVLFGLLAAVLPVLLARLPAGWRPGGLAFFVTIAALAAAGLWCLKTALAPAPRAVAGALVIVSCTLYAVASIFALPAYYAAQPNQALLEAVMRERRTRPDAAVGLRLDPTQIERDLLFYQRLVTEPVPTTADLQQKASSSRPYLLLTTPVEAADLQATAVVRRVGEYDYLPSRVTTLRGILSGTGPSRLVLLATFEP